MLMCLYQVSRATANAAFLRAVPSSSPNPCLNFSECVNALGDIAHTAFPGKTKHQALCMLTDSHLDSPSVPSPSVKPQMIDSRALSSDESEVAKFCVLHGIPNQADQLLGIYSEFVDPSTNKMSEELFAKFVSSRGLLGPSLLEKQVEHLSDPSQELSRWNVR